MTGASGELESIMALFDPDMADLKRRMDLAKDRCLDRGPNGGLYFPEGPEVYNLVADLYHHLERLLSRPSIRDEALEEAAKVAEACNYEGYQPILFAQGYNTAVAEIAISIRALKSGG